MVTPLEQGRAGRLSPLVASSRLAMCTTMPPAIAVTPLPRLWGCSAGACWFVRPPEPTRGTRSNTASWTASACLPAPGPSVSAVRVNSISLYLNQLLIGRKQYEVDGGWRCRTGSRPSCSQRRGPLLRARAGDDGAWSRTWRGWSLGLPGVQFSGLSDEVREDSSRRFEERVLVAT